jgi:predicted enzyme related to lactoylglutathione lyase
LTGWGTQPFDNDYSLWTTGGTPVGGMFRLGPDQKSQGIPPNWLPYVEVNNVDESASKATSLGGRAVQGPADIPGTGRFAVIADPQGAMFGIYKSNHASGAWDGKPVLGRFSWHELMTTDYKAAKDFYFKLFGWATTSEMDMGPIGKYSMYGQNDTPYGGIYNRSADMANVPPFWLPYIFVKDVKKSTEMAKKAGAKVVNGPMEVPDGSWIVVLEDPMGAAIALHSTTSSRAALPGAAKAGKPASKPKAAKAKAKPKKKTAAKAKPKKKAAAKAKPKKKAAAKAKPKKKAAKKKKGRR